jgi:putative protease
MKSKKLKKKKVVKRSKKIIKRKVTKKKTLTLKRKSTIKRSSQKTLSKAKAAGATISKPPAEQLQEVGKIVHYFPQVKAGVIKITSGRLAIGDMLYIKGHTTDFKQPVSSIQINHVAVNEANRGQEIGLLVKSRVRVNDTVYKI